MTCPLKCNNKKMCFFKRQKILTFYNFILTFWTIRRWRWQRSKSTFIVADSGGKNTNLFLFWNSRFLIIISFITIYFWRTNVLFWLKGTCYLLLPGTLCSSGKPTDGSQKYLPLLILMKQCWYLLMTANLV